MQGSTSRPCIGNDPGCPCQDGDACHYVDMPGSPAMKPRPSQPAVQVGQVWSSPKLNEVSVLAAVRQLDPDGGWDHETSGGWPDMSTYRALQQAVEAGYVERSSAYGAECWRLTDEGMQVRKGFANG